MQASTTKKTFVLDRTAAEENREEQIRGGTYQLYEERGRRDDMEDRLRAESEIGSKTERVAD